jgi:hypothetical protein
MSQTFLTFNNSLAAPSDINQKLREILVVAILLGVPFMFYFLHGYFALPKGYDGIRNEQLVSKKDRWHFDLWKHSTYNVMEEQEPNTQGS